MFEGVRRFFAGEAKRSAAAPLIALTQAGRPQWTPRNYAALAREGFASNAVGYRAVRMIAEAAAALPWLLYDGPREVVEHPLLDLLRRPNPGQPGREFGEQLYGFLLVAGNAYVEKVDIGGEARELHALRPDRVKAVASATGWAEAYDYSVNGQSVRIGAASVLHLRLFNPLNDHYGMSPLEAAQRAIDTHNAASAWNKAMLDNSARPSGALVYAAGDGQLTAEQFDRLKAELEQSYQGAAREVALAFGVPPMLLGIPGDNTFANYMEANRGFWRQTVLPFASRAAEALTGFLCTGRLRLAHDLDQVEALAADREALWARIGKAGFLTEDEKRAAVGYGART